MYTPCTHVVIQTANVFSFCSGLTHSSRFSRLPAIAIAIAIPHIMSEAAAPGGEDLCLTQHVNRYITVPVVKKQESELSSSPTDAPGFGWSNGAIVPKPVVFPYNRDGKVKMYHDERRWISATSSWSRIGAGSEFDSVHSVSASGEVIVADPHEEGMTIRSLIAQLCETFYRLGWAAGTGGGVSIRIPSDDGTNWRVFSTPSGIQKEDLIGSDIFELDMNQNVVVPPKTPNLRPSACTPLWFIIYQHRPQAKCVIHTHSLNAVMATLLDPTEQSETLKITHLEMLKGVGNHAYDDVLEVPIIDNRPSEDRLADQLESVLQKYPKANAVLVRRHGLFVWGDSWEQAKTQCESFDYLFESAVKMRSFGLDPSAIPKHGTYREGTKRPLQENGVHTQAKKSKKIEGTGFNSASDADNSKDMELTQTAIPLMPRHSKILLLDIEGCTTSISSVKDVMFPYVVAHIASYVNRMAFEEVTSLNAALKDDINGIKDEVVKADCIAALTNPNPQEAVVACVKKMVEYDIKASGLKTLQGHMWEYGFKSGALKGHVYQDFVPLLQWCQAQGVSVSIYSSGSVKAQKLLFGHSLEGDLTTYLTSHFDTVNAGNKKDASSYRNIATSMGVDPKEIMFVSDAEAELVAAREAGIGHVVMSVRPGNVPLTSVGREFPVVHSLMQLCGI